MLDQTLNLLTDVHHGAKMGVESIDALIKNSDDEAFRQQLLQTQNKYKQIAAKADAALQARGAIPKEIGAMSKVMTQTSVAMATAVANNANQTESKMVLRGFRMAVDELSDSMRKNREASAEARDLAFALLEAQQADLPRYTQYLS